MSWRKRSAAAALGVVTLLGAASNAVAAPVELEVLSSRADLVSGGNALVRLNLENDAPFTVELDGQDVTGQFAERPNGEVEALLTGIPNGPAVLTARSAGNGARLQLKGHPNGGPLISGPQLQPWNCQPTAVDAQCNQAATYEYRARTGSGFVAYDPQSPPSGIQNTTTTEGETVPFIVRIETGYQDRDQYKIATLFEPGQPWEPWAPQDAWNRRLVFTHGGSCGTDRAAGSAPDVMREALLGKGFMVASTALNNLGHNCNPVIIAESELMARERVSEQYGPPRATLGTGCSGGAIAQTMLAHAYPGFYDGITTQCTFVDLFTTGKQAISGHLFRRLFTPPGGRPTGPIEWPLVSSNNPTAPAVGDDTAFDTAFWPAIDGSAGCGGLTPAQKAGLRCGVLDHNLNILGTAPGRPVGIPFDNVGIQYGLKALQAGTLTPQQFVDINAQIGGLDPVTLAYVPARTVADVSALVNAYRSGYLAIGNTLADTPIIEGRGPNETAAHVTYPTKVIDARLQRFAGTTASHVLWEGPVPLLGNQSYADRMVLEMDRWVAEIQADDRAVPKAQKVRENKPADLTNRCEAADGTNSPPATCSFVRYNDAPSQVAGEGPENDILKCQLKPLNRADYPITMLDSQFATLQQAFPNGVCDWSKPGVGETETVPWLTFENGPGGQPLGDAPQSEAFTYPVEPDVSACTGAVSSQGVKRNSAGVIVGTAGNDTIVGTAGADSIRGNGGADLVCAGDGSDVVFSGAGNDTVFGQGGVDDLSGENGGDVVSGGADNDTLSGSTGDDEVWGGAGDDTANSDAGNDDLYGGEGNDRLTGSDGADAVVGQGGDDRLFGAPGNDALDGGDGNDALHGGAQVDTCDGGAGTNTKTACEA